MTIWKPVNKYEGIYAVSDNGDVRNSKGRILTPKKRGNYFAIELYRDGKGTFFSIHVLVLEAFVGPRPKGFDACHNNGNSRDNRLVNLRWGSRIENARDRFKHGSVLNRDNGHYKAILNSENIDLIKKDRRVSRLVAADYGVCASLIRNIRCGIAK